jgi:DNA invertase Pin-like site-specific DNA recombinase
MRAALYARKSNEAEDGRAESIERQLEGGRADAVKQGWSVTGEDSDIMSGARFDRPGLLRTLAAAEADRFDVLSVHSLDRLGRDVEGTRKILYQLADLGKKVWLYSTGRWADMTSFEGGILTDIETRFGQWYRDSVRSKTKHAMRAKAQKGESTGPAPYGYRNVLVEGRKAIEKDPAEAKVVVQIFERFANGAGLHALMHWLNGAKIPSPRGILGGWTSPYVRNLLRRPLYRGLGVYGTTETRYGREAKKGLWKEQRALPQDQWIQAPKPELRIVSEELQARVDARLEEGRKLYAEGRAQGKAPHKSWGRHLLSGILICPACGTGFQVATTGSGRKVYVCGARYRKAGSCPCGIRFPIEAADREILTQVEAEELRRRDGLIETLLSLGDATPPDETERLQADRERLRSERDALLESIAAGIPAASVAPKVRDREERIAALDERIASPRTENRPGGAPSVPPALAPGERGGTPGGRRAALRSALEQRCEQWVELLRSEEVAVARAALKLVLGPITFVWDDERNEPVWMLMDEKKAHAFACDVEGPYTGLVAWSAEFRASAFGEGLVENAALVQAGRRRGPSGRAGARAPCPAADGRRRGRRCPAGNGRGR